MELHLQVLNAKQYYYFVTQTTQHLFWFKFGKFISVRKCRDIENHYKINLNNNSD